MLNQKFSVSVKGKQSSVIGERNKVSYNIVSRHLFVMKNTYSYIVALDVQELKWKQNCYSLYSENW